MMANGTIIPTMIPIFDDDEDTGVLGVVFGDCVICAVAKPEII